MLKKVFALLGVFALTLFLVSPLSVSATSIAIPFSDASSTLGIGYGIASVLGLGGSFDLSSFSTLDSYLNYLSENGYNFYDTSGNTISQIRSDIASGVLSGASSISTDTPVVVDFDPYTLYGYTLSYDKSNIFSLINYDAPEYVMPNSTQQALVNRIASRSFGPNNNIQTRKIYWQSGNIYYDLQCNTTDYSLVCISSNLNAQSQKYYNIYWLDPGTLYVTTNSDSTVSVSYSGFTNTSTYLSTVNNGSGRYNYSYDNVYLSYGFGFSGGGVFSNQSLPSFQREFAGIDSCLNYLVQHFRGVGLYVDGAPWIDNGSGSVLLNDPLSFPDVVDVDGEPFYNVVVPSDASVPLGIDLTKLLDIINSIILNPAADKTLTWDDVSDAVIDKTTGDVADDDDTKPLPIDKVIFDDPIITPVGDFPVVPLPDLPSSMSGGSTILSELIDGTMSVIPPELSLMIWATFGILIVIGIFHVLHK